MVFGAKGSGKSTVINTVSMGEETDIRRNQFDLEKKESIKGTLVKSFNYQGKKVKTFEVVDNSRDSVLSAIKSINPLALVFVASAKDYDEMKQCADILSQVMNHYQMNTFVCPVLLLFSKRDTDQLPISTMEFELKVEEVAKHKHLLKKETSLDKPGMAIEAFDKLLELIRSNQPE